MRKKTLLLLLVALVTTSSLIAQNLSLKGVVVDQKTGETLIGATVVQKGTSNGSITNYDGAFSLSIPMGATLAVTYMGYIAQDVVIVDEKPLRIQLVSNAKLLDEVVVVGYGTQKVKDMTAPISTVKGSDLAKQVSSNPMSALQGKMSGVQVINSGAPGAGPSVKIRGVGSIGDYANPLYVVDGVFVDNIDFLSSSDIEDLTVLKDASAAAIYGVRAANGVVLVTTKKGKLNQTNISYDGYFGVQMPVNVMKLANTEQYVNLVNEANANTTGYVPKVVTNYPASTDWYSELLRNAIMQSHSIDISGATDKTSYSLGVNYFYQEGIMKAKNDYERYNIRFRVDQKVNDWLSMGFNSVISDYTKNNANNEAFFKAFVSPPVYNVYDDANTTAYPVNFGAPQQYGYGNAYANPVAIAYYNDNQEKGINLVMSAFAEINLIKDKLKFKTSYNLNYSSWKSRNFAPEYAVGGSQSLNHSTLSKTLGQSYKKIIDNLLTYSDKIDNNSFTVLLGQSTRMERKFPLVGTALNVNNQDEQSLYLNLGSTDGRSVTDADAYSYNGLYYFTRGTYNYADKYLATFTFRADGSSKYQEKWGYFPSVGLGWILTGEDFMKEQKAVDYLKLRTSWGMLGNDNVPANSAVTLGTTGAGSSGIFGDKLVDGVGALTVLKNYLKWEIVKEFNLGIDFSTAKQKLKGELDYYNRITSNVVFYAPITSGGGTGTLLGNYGTVQNQGIEFSLNWNDKINEDLSYNVGFNATTIANKVLSLDGKRDNIPGATVRGNYATRTEVGHPIGAFYGYEVDGVYASEGDALRDPVSQTIKDAGYFKYKDQNGDNVIDDKDKVFLGSAIPWLMTGIDFGLNYKKIDVSFTLQGQFGNKVLNAKRMNRDVFTDGNYDSNFAQNHWTVENKSTTYPSAAAYNSAFTQQANSFFVEDASYIRVQNIQIGYTFSKMKGIKNM
ncbi:MAG: TonB-dependent receptor, partial [Paludibacter sp.]